MSSIASRDDRQSVTQRIKVVTRPLHTELNNLITSRVADLSSTDNDSLACYTLGLFYVAIIYATFEALWHTILEPPPGVGFPQTTHMHRSGRPSTTTEIDPGSDRSSFASAHTGPMSDSTRLLLAGLRSPSLLRSRALRQDLRSLTCWTDSSIDEQMKQLSRGRSLTAFVSHIERTIIAKPYTTIAYAWVLYMALFSGGRHIRRQLVEGVLHRWNPPAAVHASDTCHEAGVGCGMAARTGRTFLQFANDHEEDSIKQEFLGRIDQLDTILSTTEQDAVVEEARLIFEYMTGVVDDLDELCAATQHQPYIAHQAPPEQAIRRGSKEPSHHLQRHASALPCWKSRLVRMPLWLADVLTLLTHTIPNIQSIDRLRDSQTSSFFHWFSVVLNHDQRAQLSRTALLTTSSALVICIGYALCTWLSKRGRDVQD